jgi:hypothetical protein
VEPTTLDCSTPHYNKRVPKFASILFLSSGALLKFSSPLRTDSNADLDSPFARVPCLGIGFRYSRMMWKSPSASRHSVIALTLIERLKGSPAFPGPKRVFRTVVSELARGLTCPCEPGGCANGHKRRITPGFLIGLVLEVALRVNMSVDEIARAYLAKIERQQRAEPTGRFALSRDTSERAPHFSAGTRFQSTSVGRIHCEECGLEMNGQSICSRCRASPTRAWLQFVSLGTLGILTAYNYIFVLNFLPKRVPREYLASVWLNVSEFAWLYGWVVLGVYLPAWAYYWRKKYGYSLETGARVGIGFVVILLIGAVALPIFPRMGWTWAESLRTTLDSHPVLGIVVGWAVVALALVSICCNCESRDRLLGRGKGLALLAIAVLCIILAFSLLTAERFGGRLA